MYEEFFGLKRSPFKITPDTSLFYDGGRRGDVLGALVYAVQRGEGIVKVVGEVGSGKTMLCRMLQQELPDTVEIVYIANPSVSAEDILFVIAHELDIKTDKSFSKHEVMHLLQDHLLKRHMEQKQVVLFVEEAQGMPLETLEEIRLLSNLETDQDKLLQIILFGQPELDENLRDQSIRQLKERITHEFNLSPLTKEEIHSYLNFRMREVGYTGPELISQAIAKTVEKYSAGLLRRINIIADKVLLSAFAESTHTITDKHVMAAVRDSGFDQPMGGQSSSGFAWGKWLLWLFGLIVIVLLSFNLYLQNDLLKLSETQLPAVSPPIQNNSSEALETTVKTVESSVIERNEALVSQSMGDEQESPVILMSEKKLDQLVAAIDKKKQQIDDQVGDNMIASDLIEIVENNQQKPAETNLLAENNNNSENNLLITHEETNILLEDADNEKELDVIDVSALNDLEWLDWKIMKSKEWLSGLGPRGVSIQVMMRNKSASEDLAFFLRNEWPLDVENTHLYEVVVNKQRVYRVFYGDYPTLTEGKKQLEQLPEMVKLNSPYLHSIHRMKKALL